MKKIVCIATAVLMLSMLLPAFAQASPRWAISEDLEGMTVNKDIKAVIKIHPTVWMDTYDLDGLQVDEFGYRCLNPLDNPTVTFEFDWLIMSNLPFYKQVTVTDFAWQIPQIDPLLSYQYIDGAWVLVPDPDGAGPDVIPAEKQSFTIDGAPVMGNPWISDLINNPDHTDREHIAWTVGPIGFCETAGYYEGNINLAVYQN